MMFVDNAAGLWIAPSGVIPGAVLFDLVPAADGWMIVAGVLAAVCAMLWTMTEPRRPPLRPKVRLVAAGPKARPRPQHA